MVRIGSVVTIRGQSAVDQDVTIVDRVMGNGPWQLTTRTPLGRALLGRHTGERVSIHTEAGTASFTIVGIKD